MGLGSAGDGCKIYILEIQMTPVLIGKIQDKQVLSIYVFIFIHLVGEGGTTLFENVFVKMNEIFPQTGVKIETWNQQLVISWNI